MLLTKIEQEKLQSYVIKNMIENQQAIRNQFDDTNNELTFIDYMIEKKYKQAFDLCCAVFSVYDSFMFIQHILYYIYPGLSKVQANCSILTQTSTDVDFNLLDKYTMYVYDKYATLSDIIFD